MDFTIRDSWIAEKNMLVFSFYQPDNPLLIVDIFVREPTVLAKESIPMDLNGVSIPVCGIKHLIEMKKIAGRFKDIEDIRYLQEILDEQTKHANH